MLARQAGSHSAAIACSVLLPKSLDKGWLALIGDEPSRLVVDVSVWRTRHELLYQHLRDVI